MALTRTKPEFPHAVLEAVDMVEEYLTTTFSELSFAEKMLVLQLSLHSMCCAADSRVLGRELIRPYYGRVPKKAISGWPATPSARRPVKHRSPARSP